MLKGLMLFLSGQAKVELCLWVEESLGPSRARLVTSTHPNHIWRLMNGDKDTEQMSVSNKILAYCPTHLRGCHPPEVICPGTLLPAQSPHTYIQRSHQSRMVKSSERLSQNVWISETIQGEKTASPWTARVPLLPRILLPPPYLLNSYACASRRCS